MSTLASYLVDCAQTALRCRDYAAERGANDPRYELMLQRLSVTTGLTPVECDQRIERLARGIDDSPGGRQAHDPFASVWAHFRREFWSRP